MLESDATRIRELVREAIALEPTMEDELHRDLTPPESVTKCCATCIFYSQTDFGCENWRPPSSVAPRSSPEWLSIPYELAPKLYCEGWIEVELAELLVQFRQHPKGISWHRRHPTIHTPPNGLAQFTEHLTIRRVHPAAPVVQGGPPEQPMTDWPEIDARLRELLELVEKGRKDRWHEYQLTLLTDFGVPGYVPPILERLSQLPDSELGRFLDYCIETHAYHYKREFDNRNDPEWGYDAFKRILVALEDEREQLHSRALAVLHAIANQGREGENYDKAPLGSREPAEWLSWAKQKAFMFGAIEDG